VVSRTFYEQILPTDLIFKYLLGSLTENQTFSLDWPELDNIKAEWE